MIGEYICIRDAPLLWSLGAHCGKLHLLAPWVDVLVVMLGEDFGSSVMGRDFSLSIMAVACI